MTVHNFFTPEATRGSLGCTSKIVQNSLEQNYLLLKSGMQSVCHPTEVNYANSVHVVLQFKFGIHPMANSRKPPSRIWQIWCPQ